MTKTEAINLLDNLIGMVEDNQENDYDDALKMAIEALKTDGDMTSRQAAIDAIMSLTVFKDKKEVVKAVKRHEYGKNSWIGGVSDCIDKINNLPSAQQWIPVTENTLPKEDEWVIGVVDDIHDGSDAPGIAIVKIKKGISKTERDELRRQNDSRSLNFKECDEWGNNLVPYCWKTQGMMTYFGQQITKWMPSPFRKGEEE